MIRSLRFIPARTIHAVFEVAVVALILSCLFLFSEMGHEMRNLRETLNNQHRERMERMERMEKNMGGR